jgi:predicted phage terminase large subunit-like protein
MDIVCNELQDYYSTVFMQYNEKGEPIGRQPKKYDVLIINIPPGTSKSTIASVMAPAWSWTVDPTLRHITGSYSGSLSTELAIKSRDIIRSDKYQLYFGIEMKSDEDGKTNYKNVYNGQRYATSVGGTITGIHAHVKTVDDPINPKQAASAIQIVDANEWYDKTLSSRNVNKKITITVLIMQRLGANDLTGHLLEKQKKGLRVRHVCLPATVSKKVAPAEYASHYIDGYLDPVRLGPDELATAKIELGSAEYAGQYDQTPVPEGGLLWKSNWFIPVPDENFPNRKFLQHYGTDWDLAYTDDEENSACAYVNAGTMNNKIFIDAIDWRWSQFPHLIQWMKSQHAPHYIEAKASGKSAKQTLVNAGIPAIEVPVVGGDKVARTNMATPIAEAGIVYVRASIIDRLLNDSRQGILFFPRGSHSDLNDAVVQCLQRLGGKGKGVGVVDGTEHDEDDDMDDGWGY